MRNFTPAKITRYTIYFDHQREHVASELRHTHIVLVNHFVTVMTMCRLYSFFLYDNVIEQFE